MHINIEIKASYSYHDKIRTILNQRGAEYKGTDHQIDTYFKVPKGRLKLREGSIENALIYYNREEKKGPKQSNVILVEVADPHLKEILLHVFDVKIVVDKTRDIYFIDNVKFHLDLVKGLGKFVEIEAIDEKGDIGKEKLLEQCNYYCKLFGIKEEDLLSRSYSDMLEVMK